MPYSLVIGAGRSGHGAARLLHARGLSVRVSDRELKFPELIDDLKSRQIPYIIGPQDESLLIDCEQVIISPGLSPQTPLLLAAKFRNIPIKSEIDLALESYAGRVIGVTGTNGKSTMTTLLAHFLRALSLDAAEGGNIGIPPSLLLAENRVPQIFVLELSSYQLEFSSAIHNQVSLFLSFSPDHLERHGSLSQYFRAKWSLVLATDLQGFVVVSPKVLQFALEYQVPLPKARILQICMDEEPACQTVASLVIRYDSVKRRAKGLHFHEDEILPTSLSRHNQLNCVAAIAAIRSLYPAPWVSLIDALSTMPWLPYRCETVGTFRGQRVINDSKSTNVESTLVALASQDRPVLLFLGGQGKGETYEPILKYKDKIGVLVCFGATGALIAKELQALKPLVFPKLSEALQVFPQYFTEACEGILFSPACASFDEFRNFEDRGAFFNRCLEPYFDRP